MHLSRLQRLQSKTLGFPLGFVTASAWFAPLVKLWATNHTAAIDLLLLILFVDLGAFCSAYKWSENRWQMGFWLTLSHFCSGAALLVVGAFYLPDGLPNLYLAVGVVSILGYLRVISSLGKQPEST